MDEASPREIIRGVLTTTSVSKSAKTLRPRKTPRASNVRETPVNPPSHAEVASRLLTRSRSANKRKARTPTHLTTPRTLIAGFLQTAPVAKSIVKGTEPKTVTSDASETTTGTSLHEDNTLRNTIQDLLHEAIAETPEEPIFSPSLEVEDETHLSLMKSIASDDEKTDSVEQSIAVTIVNQANDVMVMEASSRLQDSYEDEDQGAMQYDNETQVFESHPSMVTADQALQTDTVIRGDAVQISGQWRDLVTPELPLNVSTVGSRQLSRSRADVTKRSAGEKKFFGGKPPAGKTAAKKSKKPSGPRMPTNLVKNIFQHFSKAKLSKEALQAVENGSNLFFKRVSSDLMAYCQHAHRTTIELADVELLMKRQGFITDHQSLYSLVEKYLPLEYRQEIIPTVQAGNKVVLK